jgi:hypothetical protein
MALFCRRNAPATEKSLGRNARPRSCYSTSLIEARLVIAAIIKVYFDEVINRDKKDRVRRLQWLEELSKDAENRLATIKKTNKGFAQLVGAADPKNRAFKQDIALKELRSTKEELSKVTPQLIQLELQVKHSEGIKAAAMARAAAMAVSQPGSPASSLAALAGAQAGAGNFGKIPEQTIDEIIDKDAAVAKLRAAISKTKADLARAWKNAQNEDDPDVRRLEDQLAYSPASGVAPLMSVCTPPIM